MTDTLVPAKRGDVGQQISMRGGSSTEAATTAHELLADLPTLDAAAR